MKFSAAGKNIGLRARLWWFKCRQQSGTMRSSSLPHRLASRSLVVFLLLGVLRLALPARGAEQEKDPSALEIFDGALAKFQADRAALHQWQYHQTLTTHQFDGAGKVVAKGTWHSIVRPGDPDPLEYTGKSVEGKLSFFEGGTEEQKPVPGKSSPPASTKPVAKTKKNEAEWAIEVVRKYNLRNRYDWKRLPDSTTAGEEAYVLSFTPKPKQNTTTREERFFGLLAGRMWVSKHDFTVLRAEGALQSPASLFWIIAQVTTFQFTYRLEPAHDPNRLLRLSRATARTVVAFPFYKVRQKHWQTVEKYEPRAPRGEAER
jgi:hypothetical protein